MNYQHLLRLINASIFLYLEERLCFIIFCYCEERLWFIIFCYCFRGTFIITFAIFQSHFQLKGTVILRSWRTLFLIAVRCERYLQYLKLLVLLTHWFWPVSFHSLETLSQALSFVKLFIKVLLFLDCYNFYLLTVIISDSLYFQYLYVSFSLKFTVILLLSRTF